MERHVLVVFPHPDDETFSSGGTIAMHTQAGTPVTYVCGTLGEMGRNMGKPFFATRESLPQVREQELREACQVLGIRDLRLLGLRDKTVEFEDREALAERIRDIILELKPSLIITHYPGFAVHPDHNALGAATVRAVEMLPKDQRPTVHCSAFSRDAREKLGDPDVINDVRAVFDIKMAAIRAHRSQSEAMLKNLEEQFAKNPDAARRMEAERSKEAYYTYRFAD
ncbi:bacillithiol biosynthesis deacetylase BshB2 [Alicyclobacillus shizuokensis]|uniref:bacillithiol biosynthesis deacetylase BshB2 n=1 Tax=Alicyclobacillus shizuokensis TaxID=392014 RepID=UPI00082FCD9D|nr:bacillithiol biosynthesis deacetylase BshB2 [Alicyclobacillus shizuokensis]MCL6626880.1 bacillithiol biosynthesis deacetylase BshB2 [Alicyclobacillus shizuokensis]